MADRSSICGALGWLALWMACVAAHSPLAAQESTQDSTSWVEQYPHLFTQFYQDTSQYVFLLVDGGDTIRPETISASYDYRILYDSTGETRYLFTECRHNGELIRLAKWVGDRRVNADAPVLSFNSTTVPFLCRAGDTISFYRELSWRDPRTGLQDTNNYYALDTLAFSVELIRLSDSTRILLLDSMGIMPSPAPGTPIIHGTQPVMAVVKHPLPATFPATEAFMRVRLSHAGSGAYWFTRSDGMTINVSNRINDTSWQAFIDLFGQGRPKYALPELSRLESAESQVKLTVEFPRGSRDEVGITFGSEPNGGSAAIAVYDGLGNVIFLPYMTCSSRGDQRIRYRFDRSGTYFIGLLHQGRLVATRKIQVML